MKWNETILLFGAGNPKGASTKPISVMHGKRILIPLDLVRGTIDPLVFVQGMAAEAPICVTLLHVVNVNLAPTERAVYEELCAEAQAALTKLARLFFDERQETRVSVRVGRPNEQILAEARASHSELIILSGGKARSWARLFARGTTERVVRSAPCATLVLPPARANVQFVPPSFGAEDIRNAQCPSVETRARRGAGTGTAVESNRIIENWRTDWKPGSTAGRRPATAITRVAELR